MAEGSDNDAAQMSVLFDLWLVNHLISGALDDVLADAGGLSGEDFGFYSLLRRFGPATAAPLSVHPVIARSGLSALSTAIPASCPEDDLAGSLRACADLRKGFAEVGDGRQDRGREHPVAAVLALAAGAVVAGMRSFTAI